MADKPKVQPVVRTDGSTCTFCGSERNVLFTDANGNLVEPIVTTGQLNASSEDIRLVHECSKGCCS